MTIHFPASLDRYSRYSWIKVKNLLLTRGAKFIYIILRSALECRYHAKRGVPMARVLMAADNAVTREPIESRLETERYDLILAEDGTSTLAAVVLRWIGI